jgi:hypothetical protein
MSLRVKKKNKSISIEKVIKRIEEKERKKCLYKCEYYELLNNEIDNRCSHNCFSIIHDEQHFREKRRLTWVSPRTK